jgi:hypothetical protein
VPDHLAGGAELRADELRFPHQRLQDDVFLALLIDEIAAPDFGRPLQLAVDAAVPLLEARRVPRKINVDEIVAAHLEIDPFARSVCADENSQRVLCRIRVEAALQLLAADQRRRARE